MLAKGKPVKPANFGERTTSILTLDLLRNYRREWLCGDLIAGLLIFATTIPAALAYGELAGLQPSTGFMPPWWPWGCMLSSALPAS